MTDATAPRPAGVRDVARVAGVSTQTVSRVINDHPNIRVETRERVLAAIAELDYRVNNAARTLGTASTRTIGVIASDAELYGPAVAIAALEQAARDGGRWIATAHADASDPLAVADAAQNLLAQGVDGIIVVAAHARTLPVLEAADLGVPFAAMHAGSGADAQADAAATVVSHLVDLGHRRIGRLAGPEDWLEESARATGHTHGLEAHRLRSAALWRGDWSARSAAHVAAQVALAVRTGAVTAVAAANDQMALGLIAGLRAQGIRVPEDVSVTGFDDNPDAAYYVPALTTVRIDIAGEAQRCVGEVISGTVPVTSANALSVADAPRLVVRDSTSGAT
ncbi:LacI family DNA-binding transcriptional regulator [Microbacterium sediminicola]|uniref:LacI family DNA-binding transcriptional regulator n=1 Tax=Microbacterium sediminicola TaxID=415210 RepID=A0ABP4U8T3_9MICO